MKKKYLILLIFANIIIWTKAQNCNYAVELIDDFGDGWGVGNDIIVEVEGTPVDTFTLVSGAGPEGHYISVADGEVIDVTFRANGSYPNECRVVIKDCQATDEYNDNPDGVAIPSVTVSCTGCMSGDCENSEQICDNTTISSNPNGSGYNDDLNAGNWGTLINGEHYANWMHFQAAVDCEVCFTISNTNKVDYDFAVWSGIECPPSTQPLRCSYARMVTGLPDAAYNTGMQNTDLCTWEKAGVDICGNSSDGFTSCINAMAGQKFTMLVDNWDGISTPFTLTWSFNVADPLNCEPIDLPVELIGISYNCSTQILQWQTASEINNDYFALKVGREYKNGKLVANNEYRIYGNGNSNQLASYEYNLEINNSYVEIWQTDYNGTTTLLNTNYINCKGKRKSISISPNSITTSSYTQINGDYKTIQVYDMLGNSIYPRINNNRISGLSCGIYIIVIDKQFVNKLIVN